MDEQQNDLTGSFALNALGDSEREEVIRHAEASGDVRGEIDAFQETAALLGLSTEPVEPPARLKANIMSAIRATPQLPPIQAEAGPEARPAPAADTAPAGPKAPDPDATSTNVASADRAAADQTVADARTGTPSAGKGGQRFFALAAGVLLIAAGVLSGVAVNQHAQQQRLEQQLSALRNEQAELTKILTAADAKSKTQRMDDGARVTLAYSASTGMMAVTAEGLPALPSGKGYELWLISDAGAVPAGMIDGAASDGMVMVSGSMDGVTHFGITVEPASGSPAPTTEPIMLQAL
ncbi:anti-sigma factor [Paeniglutamicibacter sp. R2-26]|uniref:anti-sigma factor n=1 Tax=Paeniglutamicibacter sp. R2-26 TaxID=3144417 RepID=UPI003EE6FBF8